MAQQYLPVDAEAEASVIIGLLTAPDVFLDVTEILTPEDFALVVHQDIYRAALACDAAGRPVDVITVTDALRRTKRLSRVGGAEAVEAFAARSGESTNIMAHAQIVAERSRLRKLFAAGRAIATDSSTPEAEAAQVLAEAESRIFAIGQERSRGSMIEMAQAVPKMLEALARARTTVLSGQSTGFEGLDRLTGGFQGGQLIILAARPAMGKSALGVQIARHIAETSGGYVPLLSYEMSHSEITTRMLSTALGYDLLKLRSGDVPAGMERDTAIAAQKMAELSMLIDDNPPETIGGVRSAMRRLARRGPVSAVVVDYLQMLSGESRQSNDNRNQEVSEISRGLKRLATELDVPVIALSQLNRQLEQRPNKRPSLSDLRESGSLEQDANAVLFLYREHVYNASADPSAAELIIAKQRNGPLGTVRLRFNGTCAKFSEDSSTGSYHTTSSNGSSYTPPANGGGWRNKDPF
jgi:replicative DNA helicase